MSPLLALRTTWRRLRPRIELQAGARALVKSLEAGRNLGEALEDAGPLLAKVAVSEASARFEGGALALFIVEVRDSLRRQLELAGQRSGDPLIIGALCGASTRVDGDTFVQHLVNELLRVTELYVEAQPLLKVPEAKCAVAVTELFQRSLCVLISRTDAARVLGERTHRLEFLPLPAPSAPRS